MASLSADILHDILKRLDGAALARAGCACADLRDISREEELWENACRSLWPSTNHDDVRSLIISVGGFRKFYADCFTLILNKDVPAVQTNKTNLFAEEWDESEYYFYFDGTDELEKTLPSDFVSLIDIQYKDRALFSNIIWGIPSPDDANGWFNNCPFRIDVLHHSPENNDNNSDGEVFLSTIDDLPSVPSLEQERKDGKLWRELNNGIKLSWIMVNRKMKLAVNLSSWHPLGGQRHWPTDTDFVLRFGSVLPAKEVLPCQVAKCILLMKFRVTSMGSEDTSTLALTELNMQIEDMEGVHLNGHRSLLVLKEALSCHRSRNYDEVLDSCHLYLRAQSRLKEERRRTECRFDTLCIVGGITSLNCQQPRSVSSVAPAAAANGGCAPEPGMPRRGACGGGKDKLQAGRAVAGAESGSGGTDSLPEEAPARAAGAVGGEAGTAAFVAAGERMTITLPRIAGSDLREARAAAAAVSVAVTAMGIAPTCQADGREEGAEGRPDLVAELEEDDGGGRSGRRRQQSCPRRHGRERLFVVVMSHTLQSFTLPSKI